MTTATDHKNNLNRTGLKRDNARRLRVETIANSAGGTAQVAIVAQPSTGFLNGRFYADKSPTDFFSVLRLCGSRQVVAPCCAD